ncbi:MAG: hypothetical protein ABJA02_16895 [Acidobacteriota bacterium]
MKLIYHKNILMIAIAIAAFILPAFGHPLGNFSINQYSRIEVGRSDIRIRQAFDMAEIPTFQATASIDLDKNGVLSDDELNKYLELVTPGYVRGLSLSISGEPIDLTVTAKRIWTEPGAGDLPTLKITWDLVGKYTSSHEPGTVHFEDQNYADRIGWNEIVLKRDSGISVFNSNAYGSGLTDELKSYPQASLSSPLNERSADFSITAGTVPDGAVALRDRDGHAAVPVQTDRLAELIAVPVLTPAIALFGLLLAFGFGAMHAMSPGHGKTVVGAYLVGSRGTLKHAIFLGLTVTITHTIGVFALGLITLFASNFILPERLMPFLSFVSGLLVFFIGISLFKDRLFSAFGWGTDSHHAHDDGHVHDVDGEHVHDGVAHTHGGTTHTHVPPADITWRSLLGLGISGGLLPCPSALVLMLSAISLGRIGYGLILTVVFSFGLAATLTGVGLAFLYLGKAFSGTSLAESRIFKAMPVFSALVIACVGAVICYTSLG